MELKIVEISDTKPFSGMPISYRVSLKIHNGLVILQREYFRVGFHDGEQFDKFYFDNEWNGRQGSPLCRCSFISRKIDDKEYLLKKESELIRLFHDKCIQSKKNLEKELRKTTREINNNISNFDDIINYFEYTKRGNKLKKLKNKIK